jgi:hypothetical protein
MDPRNFAIGVLSTTATVLLVGVVLLYSRPEGARADGMTTSGGNYVITVGSLTKGDEEVVYVVDTSTDKMLVFRFDGNRRQIEIVQGVDLAEARRASTPPGQQPAGAEPSKPRTRQP